MPARRLPYAELERLASDFARDNAALRERLAQLESPPLPMTALKLAAYNVGISPERLRRWAVEGKVVAELVGHQWFVQEQSLADRMRSLNGTASRSR